MTPVGRVRKTARKTLGRSVTLNGTNNLRTRQTLHGILQSSGAITRVAQQLVQPILTLIRTRLKSTDIEKSETLNIVPETLLQGQKVVEGSTTGSGDISGRNIIKRIQPILILQRVREKFVTFSLHRTGVLVRQVLRGVQTLPKFIRRVRASVGRIITIRASRRSGTKHGQRVL